jgi:hypothetical protein
MGKEHPPQDPYECIKQHKFIDFPYTSSDTWDEQNALVKAYEEKYNCFGTLQFLLFITVYPVVSEWSPSFRKLVDAKFTGLCNMHMWASFSDGVTMPYTMIVRGYLTAWKSTENVDNFLNATLLVLLCKKKHGGMCLGEWVFFVDAATLFIHVLIQLDRFSLCEYENIVSLLRVWGTDNVSITLGQIFNELVTRESLDNLINNLLETPSQFVIPSSEEDQEWKDWSNRLNHLYKLKKSQV